MLHFLLNLWWCAEHLARTELLFPDVLYCQQNDLWTKEKYWAFWTLVFFIFGVKKDGRFGNFLEVFCGSAAGLSAPWYQRECSATAITLDLHWAWEVQGPSVRTSLTLHTNTLIWILPNSSWNSLTLLHVLAPGWQSFFPTPSQGRESVGGRVSLATTRHTFLILCNSEGLPRSCSKFCSFRKEGTQHHLTSSLATFVLIPFCECCQGFHPQVVPLGFGSWLS